MSAKCSDSSYVGYYVRASKPANEPLSTRVAHDDDGLRVITGRENTTLESLGSLDQFVGGGSEGKEFEDECPGNGSISGYQALYSSGGGILQLQFLCTEEDANTSQCGTFYTVAQSRNSWAWNLFMIKPPLVSARSPGCPTNASNSEEGICR
jgi:hypothetical protein